MKALLLIAISCLFISSCGVKPKDVEGREPYPRTYPDISTDPKP